MGVGHYTFTNGTFHSTMMPPGHIYIVHVVTITTKSAYQALIIQIGSYTQSISKKNCQEQRMMARPHRPNQIFSDCMAPGNFFFARSLSHSSCKKHLQKLPKLIAPTQFKDFHKTTGKTNKKYSQKTNDQTNENKQKALKI